MMDRAPEDEADMAPTQPYHCHDLEPHGQERDQTQDTVNVEEGPGEGGQLRSPTSWEEHYEQMRHDERMTLRMAVEDEEFEQARQAEALWGQRQSDGQADTYVDDSSS